MYFYGVDPIDPMPITKASSSAKEEILKAVETTKHWATDLMYGVRASIYEALESVEAKVLELKTKQEAVIFHCSFRRWTDE